ncbi:MAG: hypothetical protein MJ177_09135 [Clostridia bacterium]|nr:hypothetical protein [Clostridia bacterium]
MEELKAKLVELFKMYIDLMIKFISMATDGDIDFTDILAEAEEVINSLKK